MQLALTSSAMFKFDVCDACALEPNSSAPHMHDVTSDGPTNLTRNIPTMRLMEHT